MLPNRHALPPLRRLFMWLPLYNLVVIAFTLAYQAPLQALWNGRWHAGDEVPL